MKTLRQITASVALTLLIALSASAGEMGAGITQPPPPPNSTVAGEMGAGITATNDGTNTEEMSTSIDPVREVALNLLQSVLSLF